VICKTLLCGQPAAVLVTLVPPGQIREPRCPTCFKRNHFRYVKAEPLPQTPPPTVNGELRTAN
jgi:hypothetical protein